MNEHEEKIEDLELEIHQMNLRIQELDKKLVTTQIAFIYQSNDYIKLLLEHKECKKENKKLKQALEVLIDIVSGNNPRLNLSNYKKLVENMEDG